jgi:hypothetical protein
MSVNHNINVVLRRSSGGSNSTTTRTSSVRAVRSIQERTQSRGLNTRSLSRSVRAIRTFDVGALGLFGGISGAGLALAQETLKTANKALDIYLDINLARTGESMKIGNIKRVKGYILNPSSYVKAMLVNEFITKPIVNRQNQAKDYYRELSGNMIVGSQYGKR